MTMGSKGFTLIEVMLSLVILMVGLVAVNKVLLSSVATLGYVDARTQVSHLLSKKIWEFDDALSVDPAKVEKNQSGDLMGTNRTFGYELRATPIAANGGLYKTDLGVKWIDAGHEKQIARTFYVLAREEKKAP